MHLRFVLSFDSFYCFVSQCGASVLPVSKRKKPNTPEDDKKNTRKVRATRVSGRRQNKEENNLPPYFDINKRSILKQIKGSEYDPDDEPTGAHC